MLAEKSDGELLLLIDKGSSPALVELYTRYKISMYRYCLRLVQNTVLAEDAVQETFLRLMNNVSSIRNPDSIKFWLFSTARHYLFNALRDHRREQVQQCDDEDIMMDTSSPLDSIIDRESTEAVRAAVRRLKPEYRELLLLREYEHLSYVEIAQITGCSPDLVKSRLFKARKAIVKQVKTVYS